MPSPGVTKSILADTMKQLMLKEQLSKISVGEIVEQCDLTRNSFYYHFRDKYDLVNWIFYTDFVTYMSDADEDSGWETINSTINFFYENKDFYKNALSISGQNSFSEYFSELLKDVLTVRMEYMFEEHEDREFCALFYVDAFISTLSRWLKDGAKVPPEKLSGQLYKALTGTSVLIANKYVQTS